MEEKNLYELISKNYRHIYNIIYLCTGEKEFSKEISFKIFAKLYYDNPWFIDEITYKKWMLSHTLSLINDIYKSADKKNKKVNDELIALDFEQIVALYMDECMELPFEVIVEVLDRKSKTVRKLITKSKKILMSHKEMNDIKEYIENIVLENGVVCDDYADLTQNICDIDKETLYMWEESLKIKILKKNIIRCCVLILPPILVVLMVCLISYIRYDNYNIFEVMNFGDRGEWFEADLRAVEDGRCFTSKNTKITLEKSWYDEEKKEGYCYFVISCEGVDMRTESIEVSRYGQKSIKFGKNNKLELYLLNIDGFGRMYDIKYYTTKEALYLGFNFELDKVLYGCVFGVDFVDWYSYKSMSFEFGTLNGGEPKYE